MNERQIFYTITIITIITFLLRFLPFVVFSNDSLPPFIRYFSKVLPLSLGGLLIIYCLKDLNLSEIPQLSSSLLAICFITIIHLIKKNALLSILSGTILYMFLIQVVFK